MISWNPSDLPDEYAHSDYTNSLKGAYAKAKANAANGWYRCESRFALPVYSEDGEVERYNVYHVYMIVRHDLDNKKYLYDVINLKKETSKSCRAGALLSEKPFWGRI